MPLLPHNHPLSPHHPRNKALPLTPPPSRSAGFSSSSSSSSHLSNGVRTPRTLSDISEAWSAQTPPHTPGHAAKSLRTTSRPEPLTPPTHRPTHRGRSVDTPTRPRPRAPAPCHNNSSDDEDDDELGFGQRNRATWPHTSAQERFLSSRRPRTNAQERFLSSQRTNPLPTSHRPRPFSTSPVQHPPAQPIKPGARMSSIEKIYAYTHEKASVSAADVQDVWKDMREKISQAMWRRRVDKFKKNTT